MTALVSLDQAKEHLRVTWDAEDVLIAMYIDAAQSNALAIIDRQADDPILFYMVDGVLTLKKSIFAAILLIVGDMYVNREAVSASPLSDNPTLDRLLYPLRRLGV